MSRISRAVKSERGFTLIEILAAFAILGASFALLLAANSSAAKKEGTARKIITGSMLAREILTKTEVEGFPELGQDSEQFDDPFQDYSWERRVATTSIPEILEVKITVTWLDGRHPQSITLSYYVAVRT